MSVALDESIRQYKAAHNYLVTEDAILSSQVERVRYSNRAKNKLRLLSFPALTPSDKIIGFETTLFLVLARAGKKG